MFSPFNRFVTYLLQKKSQQSAQTIQQMKHEAGREFAKSVNLPIQGNGFDANWLIRGKKLRRAAWPAGVFIFKVDPNTPAGEVLYSGMPDKYISLDEGWCIPKQSSWIAMHTIDACIVLWMPTQFELLENDWQIISPSTNNDNAGFSKMLEDVQ